MMTKKDLDFFLDCINEKKVRLFKLVSNDINYSIKELIEISKDEIDINKSYATYIWNTDFLIDHFDDIYDRDILKKMPLIELSFYNQGNQSLGRLYWNTDHINECDFDTEKFSKWFEKLRRIIRSRSVRSYDDHMKIHVFEDYWDKHKYSLTEEEEKYKFNGKTEDFFENANGYENIALLKFENKCYNHCNDCKRIITDHFDHYNQAYFQAFDNIKNNIEIIIVGIGFDPLTSNCSRILEYMHKMSDVKIIMITNGIDDLCCSISCINNTVDELYIFIPAQTPEKYLLKTDSGLGLSAYKKAAEFAKKAARFINQEKCKLNIVYDVSRNDIYRHICEKYEKTSNTDPLS